MPKMMDFAVACALALALGITPVALAAVYEVSGSGKTAESAGGNCRMSAIRSFLQTVLTPEQSRQFAMDLRKAVFKNVSSLTELEVLDKKEEGGKVTQKARVTVNETAVRSALAEIPGLSVAAAPSAASLPPQGDAETQENASVPGSQSAASRPEPVQPQAKAQEQAGKPEQHEKPRRAAEAMPDEDFVRMVESEKTMPQDIIAALENGANPNAVCSSNCGSTGWPVLMIYLDEQRGPRYRDKKAEVVRAFIRAGSDVSWANTNFSRSVLENALFVSIHKEGEGLEILRAVLQAKPDMNRLDDHGSPFLYQWMSFNSIVRRTPEMLEFILSCGADPNGMRESSSRRTPVLFEAINLSAEFVRVMLSAGANPNIADHRKESALFYAVKSNADDAALTLLEAGADPNLANEKGETPLLEACGNEKIDIAVIRAMLEHKADPNLAASGRNNLTPLIAAGAAVDAKVANGRTALIFAADNRLASIAKKLLDKGTDPNLADKDGIPPLAYAVRSGSVDVARLLLERGADINVTMRFKKENISLREIVDKGKNEEMKALFKAAGM